jgi:hypothetical protein
MSNRRIHSPAFKAKVDRAATAPRIKLLRSSSAPRGGLRPAEGSFIDAENLSDHRDQLSTDRSRTKAIPKIVE